MFLCVLVSNLTSRYGPVVRQAKVIGVLDAAFDVLVPEFGIEKRVHVDQMPIDVCFPNSFLTEDTHGSYVHRITYMTNTRTPYRFTGLTVKSLLGSRKIATTNIFRK